MPINKMIKLALRVLSYPNMKDVYKIQRSFLNIKSPHLLKPLYKLWDHKIVCNGKEVLVRIYPPKVDNKENLMIFFHGGGWVTESVNTYNKVCKSLAQRMKCRVISVEYRLAPENPFPNGLEDCYAVAKEIMAHAKQFDIAPEKITLIGDSAGGNLAAAVSLMARDRGEFCIYRQILIYPLTNNNHTNTSTFQSVHDNGTDYLLTSKRVCEYMELYASRVEDYNNPYFAPLISSDLTNQPKTLIITAEYDPLRDEGEEYGRRLERAGNMVCIYRMKDALHGFFSLDYHFAHVKRAYEIIRKFLDEESKVCQKEEGSDGVV